IQIPRRRWYGAIWRAVLRLSRKVVFRALIKALMGATDLEGCGPSQPLKPVWALLRREVPFSLSGIFGTPPGYGGGVALQIRIDGSRRTLARSRARWRAYRNSFASIRR